MHAPAPCQGALPLRNLSLVVTGDACVPATAAHARSPLAAALHHPGEEVGTQKTFKTIDTYGS